MSNLRPIKAMIFPNLTPGAVTGPKPELRWIAPSALYVDGTYQRDLSRKSLQLIEQIYQSFAWDRIKPPIVVDDGGVYHVIDGQHTAIAAASLGVAELPCFLIAAPDLAGRARAFVGHNTDRITVTPIAIHRALCRAGDEDALDVDRVCRRAGVTIREFNKDSTDLVGQTKAVTLIRKMIRKRGVVRARKVLECLVKAEMAPIAAAAITAIDAICAEHCDIDLDALAAIIRADGAAGLAKAHAKAAKDRSTLWSVLKVRWLHRLEAEAAEA
ncbi:ParB N-terminal domain-containing protein [Bradyrhizobium sp. SZCCHNRI1003]|uniref:ParB N-terminal domain-containing protein n=1 Tax=Bradyrhizobium sp. SZCCHNRI1003 TaxID=3057275 RepID=UPI0029166FBA|nr:ParB N-terminal domain-containing protein [Bradyrhizobium sp. SZCCHNRI1003]